MTDDDRGPMVTTLGVSDPRARHKRMCALWGGFVYCTVVALAIATVYVLGVLEPLCTLVSVGITLLLAIIGFTIVGRSLGGTMRPVAIHENGIEFHSFPMDKMERHSSFVRKEDIKKVRVDNSEVHGDMEEPETGHFGVQTSKAPYFSGEREYGAVLKAMDWMEAHWHVPVEQPVAS